MLLNVDSVTLSAGSTQSYKYETFRLDEMIDINTDYILEVDKVEMINSSSSIEGVQTYFANDYIAESSKVAPQLLKIQNSPQQFEFSISRFNTTKLIVYAGEPGRTGGNTVRLTGLKVYKKGEDVSYTEPPKDTSHSGDEIYIATQEYVDNKLENTKGTISASTNIENATTKHDRQINVSTYSTVDLKGSQINASNRAITNANYSQINASDNVKISANYSQINASKSVKNDKTWTVAGGYGFDTNPSTKNIKWEISSEYGTIKSSGAITGNSTFADFAEYFESVDGKAIPTGTIVTLQGDKIRPCNEGEEMLGVISETAGVLLNASGFCWQDRYMRNEFGGLVYEEVLDKETEQYITVPKENPNHDIEEEYIPREDREEWNIVGLTGQVYIRIDDTVNTGDFIKSGNNGVATKDENPTYVRWRVMKVTTPYDEEKGYGIALVFIR